MMTLNCIKSDGLQINKQNNGSDSDIVKEHLNVMPNSLQGHDRESHCMAGDRRIQVRQKDT